MICFDTNFLIRALIPNTDKAVLIPKWIRENEIIILPAVAWYEFLCGSKSTKEEILAANLVSHRIIEFQKDTALAAAHLFNVAGRKRAHRVDAMIAGTAIASNAILATSNRDDFLPFVEHGLKLL